MSLRCVVTGATGFLGRELTAALEPLGEVWGVSRRALGERAISADLRRREVVQELLERLHPQVVVHAAAYRDPDFCEEHREEAWRLNVEAVRYLAETLAPDAMLVYISSDYVFDGETPPYREEDPTRPVNVYGETKARAEELVRARPRWLIVRTPLLVGAGPTWSASGFLTQLVAAAEAGEPTALDDRCLRYPTWTRDVARAVVFLILRGAHGVFHVSGPRGGTAYAWAREVASLLNRDAGHLRPLREETARRARRPRDAHLCTAKLQALGFGPFTDFAVVARDVMTRFGVLG